MAVDKCNCFDRIKFLNRLGNIFIKLYEKIEKLPTDCSRYAHYSDGPYFINRTDVEKLIEETREEITNEFIPKSD